MLVFVPLTLNATTITLSGAPTGPSVFTANALNLVPNGSLIRVGALIGGTTSAYFVDFGPSTVKTAGIRGSARPSKIIGSVTNINGEIDDSQFNGLPVYIWVYNSPTISATADQGIFKSTFVFPTNDMGSPFDAVTATAVSFTQPLAIEGFTEATFSPTADNGTGNLTGGAFVLGTVVAVPEYQPSLGLAIFVGMVGLRRRRKNKFQS